MTKKNKKCKGKAPTNALPVQVKGKQKEGCQKKVAVLSDQWFLKGAEYSGQTWTSIFKDDGHLSVVGGNKCQGTAEKQWGDLNAEVVYSRIKENPRLKKVMEGLVLGQVSQPWCCFGKYSWKGREYAHKLSRQFCSPDIIQLEHNQYHFVSDLENVKDLLKAHGTLHRLSYLVHRVGNCVTIDRLDLTDALMFSDYCQLPKSFLDFLRGQLKESLEEIHKECKSHEEILAKEAYHKLLHSSMKTEMKLNLDESSFKFLQQIGFSVGPYKILVGSNTPVFIEDNHKSQKYTVRMIHDSATDPSVELFDLWLDNVLHQCDKSIMYSQNSWKIENVMEHSTEDLLTSVTNYMSTGEKLLEFLQSNVSHHGSTYWLYRHPGSVEIGLIDVTKLNRRIGDGDTSVFGYWPLLEPYMKSYEQAHLFQYSEALADIIIQQVSKETKYEPNPFKDSTRTPATPEDFARSVQSCIHFARDEKYVERLIQVPDQVSVRLMPTILKCLKVVYQRISELMQHSDKAALEHAVSVYYRVAWKLSVFVGPLNERFRHWPSANRDRIFMTAYLESLSDLVAWLLDCHSKVPLSESNIPEWQFFYLRLNFLKADVLSELANNIYDKIPLRCGPDSTLPDDSVYEQIDSVYMALSEYVKTVQFPMTIPAGYHCKSGGSSLNQMTDDLNRRWGWNFLAHALFLLGTPSYLQHVSPLENSLSSTCPAEHTQMQLKALYEKANDMLLSAFGRFRTITPSEDWVDPVRTQITLLLAILQAEKFQLQMPISKQIVFLQEPVSTLRNVVVCLLQRHGLFEKVLNYVDPTFLDAECYAPSTSGDDHDIILALKQLEEINTKDKEMREAIGNAMKILRKCAEIARIPDTQLLQYSETFNNQVAENDELEEIVMHNF